MERSLPHVVPGRQGAGSAGKAQPRSLAWSRAILPMK
jgi:hypothetical protein